MKMFRMLPDTVGNMPGVIDGKAIRITPEVIKALSRTVLGNVVRSQLCTKFFTFYETRHFTVAFTRAHMKATLKYYL